MWKAPQSKTKDEAHILQAFTETLLTGSIACIWCFSQYVQSPSGWLYICKGFWNVNNGTILLPRCTPSHPTNFFCTIQSHPTQLSTSLILLSSSHTFQFLPPARLLNWGKKIRFSARTKLISITAKIWSSWSNMNILFSWVNSKQPNRGISSSSNTYNIGRGPVLMSVLNVKWGKAY